MENNSKNLNKKLDFLDVINYTKNEELPELF